MSTPPTKNIRLTITVTPEVHETFQRMADATGISLGRAMGDWLQDTMEGAQFMTAKLVEAKAAPRQVLMEMKALATGSAEMVDEVLSQLRTSSKALGVALTDAHDAPPAKPQATPRPVIRGGKSTTKGVQARATRSFKGAR